MASDDCKSAANSEFLTGVVEGFYGRPWTYPQRKELFRRMNHMGMNAYLYAPKDDIKHRQSWRDLYTPEEEQQLRYLISESTEAGVLFIFALSPGLDITFSSAKEVEILKKKVDQVSKLGCRAFALLFDDIEPRLCPADREVFSSSARAQAMFANQIYDYLGCPDVFLFCPTEYSASLAVPNISKSEYLATVASCLAPGIAVIWTGPLVVSKRIQTTELEELSALLQHPIVLWDNLHANDYDQRRVFIGPYCGRPLALRRKGLLRGVLTNPNCEFEANYVALHTLAQWSRQAVSKPVLQSSDNEMNEESDFITPEDLESIDDGIEDQKSESGMVSSNQNVLDASTGKGFKGYIYKPREALHVALRDWLALMLQDQQVLLGASKPGTTVGTPTPMETDIPENLAQNEAAMQVESSPANNNVVHCPENTSSETINSADLSGSVAVTVEDLELFADLFYLPFSHGPGGMKLLELGYWLREHSYACGPNSSDPEKSIEWNKKMNEFVDMVATISRLRDRIQRLPSKSIAYELTPYITEVYTVIGIILDYFRWLETGVMAYRSMSHLRRLLTWFSPGYRDMVTSGDQEPWTFRGGLITELQRILPLESAQDLFPAPSRAVLGMTTIPCVNWPDGNMAQIPPVIPVHSTSFHLSHKYPAYVVRPYKPEDKPHMYALCRKLILARVGLPENALPSEYQDLPGDRYLLHFLEHSPENCLVVEGPSFNPISVDSNGENVLKSNNVSSNCDIHCVGFGVSAPDAVSWARERNSNYRESMKNKYLHSSTILYTSQNLNQSDQSVCVTNENDDSNTQCLIKPTTPSPIPDDRCGVSSSGVASAGSVSGGSTRITTMTSEELIKFLLTPIYREVNEASDIAAAASILPPPEPLGGILPMEPTLSGCLEPSEVPESNIANLNPAPIVPTNLPLPAEPKVPFPIECVEPVPPTQVPVPLLTDTAPPSPPANVPTPMLPETCCSSPATNNSVVARGIVAGGPEALHTALSAHPAVIWVEFDDIGVSNCVGGPTPAMLLNHNLGLGIDPPELILDSVARRLFICLLASLKTIGAHGAHAQLDLINEQRAELYRRFGFYPIPAASTEQNNVLARLI